MDLAVDGLAAAHEHRVGKIGGRGDGHWSLMVGRSRPSDSTGGPGWGETR